MGALLEIGLLAMATVVVADVEWPPQFTLDKMKPVTEKCLGSNPVPDDVLANARNGKPSDDQKLKEFLLCVFDAIQSIDHNTGEVLYYRLLELLPDAPTQRYAFELSKHCIKIHEPKAIDTAYKFVLCMFDTGSRYAFF